VIPRARAAEVAELASAREEKEAAVRKRLAAGELGLDVYGMRDALARAGLRYLD
ncbi:MAG: 4-carboxy-4-hydroxy-2-oxoadipate aldolase/oxaloacetate decarboxylase, partial [Betaproteobacteria bacterium]